MPRELFIPKEEQPYSYQDSPLPIGMGQTISQPYIVAYMLQLLQCTPESVVLDVGAGSGYQAALLSHLCGHVYGIERLAPLADRAETLLVNLNIDNVTLVVGDGSEGLTEFAPYDRIICGAAIPAIPQAWIDQLADPGRIVAPLGGEFVQELVVMEKSKGQFHTHREIGVRFVPLIGKYGFHEEHRYLR